jgi:AcrR family transcriptional regulator
MGRRSIHTSEELREIILEASTDLIREQGFGALSAREIARRINYSPGTLYNVFENLDDLILTVEGRMLDRLLAALDIVPTTGNPRERVKALAEHYLKFTRDNPKLWGLLFEHHLPQGRPVPGWYQQKLDQVLDRIEAVLAPVAAVSSQELRRAARVVWAGMHGITALTAATKLSGLATEDADLMVEDFVNNYVTGLESMLGSSESTAV